MDWSSWLIFAAASLAMAIIPGPGVATIVGFAFSSGRRVAMASVGGMAVGNAIAISVSLAGAGAVLGASALAFTILKWLGALYLISIGVIAIVRSGRDDGSEGVPVTAVSTRAAFLTTAAVGTFHPKTILFFVAFASQFIRADAPYLPQAAIIVGTFTLIALGTDTLYALAASATSRMVQRRAVRTWVKRAGGGVIIAAGMATAAMRR